MTPRSCKNKGARGQIKARDLFRAIWHWLHPDDITSQVMGANGADLILTPAARAAGANYSVEVKKRKAFAILTDFKQAARHHPDREPLLVFEEDRGELMVLMRASHFADLHARVQKP